jgi:hypothetical protein
MATFEELVHTFETDPNSVTVRNLAQAIHEEVSSGALSEDELKTHLTHLLSVRYVQGETDCARRWVNKSNGN